MAVQVDDMFSSGYNSPSEPLSVVRFLAVATLLLAIGSALIMIAFVRTGPVSPTRMVRIGAGVASSGVGSSGCMPPNPAVGRGGRVT